MPDHLYHIYLPIKRGNLWDYRISYAHKGKILKTLFQNAMKKKGNLLTRTALLGILPFSSRTKMSQGKNNVIVRRGYK